MTDLPALDQPQAYVVVGPDDQRGPYTLELLISEVVEGRLSDNTPVWWPGLADWTTMAAHGGVAAEVARRRNPAPAPEPAAFDAPVAPPPPQPGQQAVSPDHGSQDHGALDHGQPGAPEQAGYPVQQTPGQDYSAPPPPGAQAASPEAGYAPQTDPQSTEQYPVAADPGQYTAQEPVEQQGTEESPGMFGTQPAYPMDSDDATVVAGEAIAATAFPGTQPVPDSAEQYPGAIDESDGQSAGVFGVGGGDDVIEVPAVEVTPADFVAADSPEAGFRAAGAAEGLDPAHGVAFAELIRRSRARADAAAIVEQVDTDITDSVAAAALELGMEPVSRDDLADRHELNYRSADGTTVSVTVGRVTGHAMAVRDGHVDLDVSATSTSYGGGVDAGTGEHGEITVRAAEFGGASIAAVSLLLPLADYVGEDMSTDADALRRDIEATMASVRARLA